jgi:5'-nucleotidase
MIILVDMDGVLADLEAEFFARFQQTHGIDLSTKRTEFYMEHDWPEHVEEIHEIMSTPGLFYSLSLIVGGLNALEWMARSHDVFICTAPLLENPTCVQDKVRWVEKYLGPEWTRRMIITKDKTLVHGDILIDDKINIQGVRIPTWHHVLFHAPYNLDKEHAGERLHAWHQIEQLLERF